MVNNSLDNFSNVSIKIAAPEMIREWSYGEVKKPETINYRSYKPEKDGLFCEKIFGPVKNWECNCGKYKRIRYKGVICDRCGVEVTTAKVRRQRMGHIELAIPIVHIWFFKSLPSKIGHLLGVSSTVLEKIIYYESYVIIEPGDSGKERGELISEEEYDELEDKGAEFKAMMGGDAVLELLKDLDLDEISATIRWNIKHETSVQRKNDLLKRLKMVEYFRKSDNDPAWMVLKVLPVIPPDLRPLVPLEGGRFATSDLNDLYRRVINRNNRLKKLLEVRAPEVILRNEKRMLQESIDALFDNGRRGLAVNSDRGALKSLSELLRGKQGRFRQNLLGKRVDYSGRSVIVVGPELHIHECGLPKSMALELYKPFIIKKLEEKGLAQTIKSAKRFVEREGPELWDILEEIIADHPVLLNRAPTLHRLGIQAFYPRLVEGKAIRLHPFVCAAFNADFDGDQMAVHLPLSPEARIESRTIILSVQNLLHPASGNPIVVPSQDIVLGLYYMTKSSPGKKGEGKLFPNIDEVEIAYQLGEVDLHARIKLLHESAVIDTTVGRAILNKYVHSEIDYVNTVLDKKKIVKLIDDMHLKLGNNKVCVFLDSLKTLGFEYSTLAGVTVAMEDLVIPEEKEKLLSSTEAEVDRVNKQARRGYITDGERYNKIIDLWTHATNDVAEAMMDKLRQDRGGFNPVFMMAESGARGSKDQIKQLAGMRGLMQKPQKKLTGKEVIENPIKANFKEGLSVLEYFISTHGARKGLADTALKTADAGYLTRRLVDVAQDLIITEEDCGTLHYVEMEAHKEGEEIISPLHERVLGRVLATDLMNPLNNDVIAKAGTDIDEKLSAEIKKLDIERANIRTVLNCESEIGVCAQCYGRNLARRKMAIDGDAVGIMAAQSIGEPGTQLTLRTFHIGGTSAREVVQPKILSKHAGRIKYSDMKLVTKEGTKIVVGRQGQIFIQNENDDILERHNVPYGSYLHVDEDSECKSKTLLFESDPYNMPILTTKAGKAEFEDIIIKKTLKRAAGGGMEIIDDKNKKLQPSVVIVDDKGERLEIVALPTGARLEVKDGQKLAAGDIIGKMPRESARTKDITGGLPRVSELFEARVPKNPAVISEVDGIVRFGDRVKGKLNVFVQDEHGEEWKYDIPTGKHMAVHDGDRVIAGQKLCEGSINPHDILRIQGEFEVQRYLVDEIQDVYRLQGVNISDKHIEVIVRQMLRMVTIEKEGDTNFIEGVKVSKVELRKENERVMERGGEPATYSPLLLGITRASLVTDSFLSAASFQETTRVLSDAAVQGKRDDLRGLKENIIIGNIIPSGTGAKKYRNFSIKDLDSQIVGDNVEGSDVYEFRHEDTTGVI